MAANLPHTQKKFNIWPVVVLLVFLAGVVYLIWQSGILAPRAKEHTIHFEVIASAGGYAIVTYKAGEVNSDGAITVATPWRKTITVPLGTQVFLTAGNPAQNGSISCQIDLNGTQWKYDKVAYPKEGVACAGITPKR